MDEQKRQIIAIAVFAVALVGFAGWMFFRPRPKLSKPDLPSGIYYTGPMKGKGGQSASDDLYPELGETPRR